MARAAVLGRLTWQAGQVAGICEESSPETVLYAAELAERSQAGDGLEVSYVYTRSAPPGAQVRVGRLAPVVLAAPGWTRKDAPAVFICGPTGFVEAAASLLVKAGHDLSVIKTERFGPSGGQA